MISILKNDLERIKLFDSLSGTKIVLTLIWEENESENDYII